MISRAGKKRRRSSGFTQPLLRRDKLSREGAGFTLLELVLVTLIIGVLIGMTAPLFKRTFSGLVAKDASYNISKLAALANERAILERKNYRLAFDYENRTYRLSSLETAEGKSEYKNIPGRFGRLFRLPQGLAFNGEKSEVIFYPDGRSDEAELNIMDQRQEGYAVLFKGFAGRAEVKEIIPDEK